MSTSAIVSTFENLVKPIADPSAAFVRKAISGYFCTATNLSTIDIELRFLVVIPTFTAPSAPGEAFYDRELTVSDAQGGPQNDPLSTQGNHNIIYDVTGGTQFGQTAVGELTYLGATNCVKIYWTDRFELCRGGTAQLALLPNLGPAGPGVLAREKLEIRGWSAIGTYPDQPVPDEIKRVPVLVTPEQRGTFLPLDVDTGFDPVDLAEVGQLNTSLPTSFGGAEVELQNGQRLSTNVQNFANANGIPISEIRPFGPVLQGIV